MELSAFPHAMPLNGLIGGILIGLSAALLLLGAGRIAGVSGIFARLAGLNKSGPGWLAALLFILAMMAGALLTGMFNGPVTARYTGSTTLLILGGILVGFGTRLGSGCTSGHGVCGMSRLSGRSLVATATFMTTGIAAVALMNAAGISL